jgi:hypothetical protein
MGLPILLVGLIGIDAALKSSSSEGYCPQDARWVAVAESFPAFYRGLRKSDAWKGAMAELRSQLAGLELSMRKVSGIRPTPLRCWVWLGNHFVAAGSAEGVGLCVHPGLLVRLIHAGRVAVREAPEEEGIYTLGSLFYGWRNGFLIVSASRAYVAACLAAAEVPFDSSEGHDDLRFLSCAGLQACLHIRAGNGLPVSGWIEGKVTHRSSALSLAEAWPEPPLVSVTATKWADVSMVVGWAWSAMQCPRSCWLVDETGPFGTRAAKAVVDWVRGTWPFDALPKGWDDGVDECALAVTDVDVESVTPVPQVALVLRSVLPRYVGHPLERLASAAERIPYEWNNCPGWMVPWAGEKLALCFSSCDRDWFLTTRESTMAEVAGRLKEASPVEADVTVCINWEKLAARAGVLMRKAGELELIPGMNSRDVERDVMPWVRALGCMGHLRLDGTCESDRVVFQGILAQQAHRDAGESK